MPKIPYGKALGGGYGLVMLDCPTRRSIISTCSHCYFNDLKELIVLNQDMYPNIEKWFINKVIPGIITTQRIGYIAYENEQPIASCVLKKGDCSKFCHLRIHEDFQDYSRRYFLKERVKQVISFRSDFIPCSLHMNH